MVNLEEMAGLVKQVKIDQIVDYCEAKIPRYNLTIIEEGWLSLDQFEQASKETYKGF